MSLALTLTGQHVLERGSARRRAWRRGGVAVWRKPDAGDSRRRLCRSRCSRVRPPTSRDATNPEVPSQARQSSHPRLHPTAPRYHRNVLVLSSPICLVSVVTIAPGSLRQSTHEAHVPPSPPRSHRPVSILAFPFAPPLASGLKCPLLKHMNAIAQMLNTLDPGFTYR